MKKTLIVAMTAALTLPILAQETASADVAPAVRAVRRNSSDVWPAFFAVCDYPATPDVIGIRLTIPFSTKHDNVTGFDLGLWGRAVFFEGLQVNVLRNDVKDDLAGIQAGLYNSVGGANMAGGQLGLWNEANSVVGVQAGLVNTCGEVEGFQVGLINRCETMHGYQLGLINVIREGELQFCPILNIGF